MPKALVIVQGINNKQGYLRETIAQFPQFKEYYQRIIDIETDKYFDKHMSFLFKPFRSIGRTLADVWEFYKNNAARMEVCRETRSQIQNLQALGYEVDIIAHSLGTVIALCCGPNSPVNPIKVNRTILMQSPLGIANLIARMKTNSHTERYSKNFTTKELYYTWSEEDYVSKKFTARVLDILISKAEASPVILATGYGHSAYDNSEFLLSNVKLFGDKV